MGAKLNILMAGALLWLRQLCLHNCQDGTRILRWGVALKQIGDGQLRVVACRLSRSTKRLGTGTNRRAVSGRSALWSG